MPDTAQSLSTPVRVQLGATLQAHAVYGMHNSCQTAGRNLYSTSPPTLAEGLWQLTQGQPVKYKIKFKMVVVSKPQRSPRPASQIT